ncbi:hypothetical protein D3Y55_02240 [Mesorhizobium sp. DCY119]|nr:hypothetical protein D3Y55_02240 [Mesorhizobium sp. DCY119]
MRNVAFDCSFIVQAAARRCPPLACRPSPPQVGRSAFMTAARAKLLISPPVGEMAGRPEGSAKECGRRGLGCHHSVAAIKPTPPTSHRPSPTCAQT